MKVSDLFLSNAGWLFLTPWSLLVVAISVAAFAGDLFPSKPHLESQNKAPPSPTSTRTSR